MNVISQNQKYVQSVIKAHKIYMVLHRLALHYIYIVQSCTPSVSSRSIISTLRIKYLSLRRYSPPIGPVTETDALLLLGLHSIMSPSNRNTRRSVSRRPPPTFPSTSSATAHIHSYYTHFSKISAT